MDRTRTAVPDLSVLRVVLSYVFSFRHPERTVLVDA